MVIQHALLLQQPVSATEGAGLLGSPRVAAESQPAENPHTPHSGQTASGQSQQAEAAQRLGRENASEGSLEESDEDELDGELWRLREKTKELEQQLARLQKFIEEKSSSENSLLEQLTRLTEDRKNQEQNRLDLEAQLEHVRAELAELQARPTPEPDLARLDLIAVVRAKAHYRAKQIMGALERRGVSGRARKLRRLVARTGRHAARSLRALRKKAKPHLKRLRRLLRATGRVTSRRIRIVAYKLEPHLRVIFARGAVLFHKTAAKVSRSVPPSQLQRLQNIYYTVLARLLDFRRCYRKQMKLVPEYTTAEHGNGYASTFERAVFLKENARIAAWCFWQADSTSRVILMGAFWMSMMFVWMSMVILVVIGRLASKTLRILIPGR
jgi:hypothetical protein